MWVTIPKGRDSQQNGGGFKKSGKPRGGKKTTKLQNPQKALSG